MAGLIPQDFIETLLDRVSIEEVVGNRITLKKAGSSLKACCPFHNEKTPSFHVNTQKGFYHCFGCGANGDIISFVREFDNLSFTEAVEELAKNAGLEIPRDQKSQARYNATRTMSEALDHAAHLYSKALRSHKNSADAQNYIESRGLSKEICETYQLGFAPQERSFLGSQSNPSQIKALSNSKLIGQNNFELFQGRLMFPIRNSRGKVVGFGGRTLVGDKAKYINSPESEVFHKSSELYGIYETKKALRSIEQLLVVEGYMDVVSLAQFGIPYAVATSGTATNADNIQTLLKHCQKITFCFDGDRAGFTAAKKAMENALPQLDNGIQISFLLLPEGEDPDTLIRKEGQSAFEDRIGKAAPLSSFLFQTYGEGLDLNIPEHRGILRERAEPVIEQTKSKVIKSALRQKLNELTYRRRQFQDKNESATPAPPETAITRDHNSLLLLSLILDPNIAKAISEEVSTAELHPETQQLMEAILENELSTPADLLYLLSTLEHNKFTPIMQTLSTIETSPSKAEVLTELQDFLRRKSSQQNQANQLIAAKLNKSPGELSEEERAALRGITKRA